MWADPLLILSRGVEGRLLGALRLRPHLCKSSCPATSLTGEPGVWPDRRRGGQTLPDLYGRLPLCSDRTSTARDESSRRYWRACISNLGSGARCHELLS